MECVISDSSAVRTLSRVFACAAKIGEDVSIGASVNQLVIRTLNASRSASGEFTMSTNFFDSYKCELDGNGSKPLHAVLSAKYLLPILKNTR